MPPTATPTTPTPDGIYFGDAAELTAAIEPGSVALSVWSPPYFVGKDYEKHLSFDGWRGLLRRTVAAHRSALRPGAFMVVNIADILAFADEDLPRIQAPNVSKLRSPVTREQVIEAKSRHPGFNRDRLAELLGCSEQTIDRRLNGNNIRGGKYQTQTRVQLVGHLLVEAGQEAGLVLYDRRVWVKDPCWANCRWHSSSYRSVDEFEYLYFFWKPGETVVDRGRLEPEEWSDWGSRGVWRFASVRANTEHEAQFPIELPLRLILLLTDAGDLVLDPFVGSGTTAIAAAQNGRRYIGIDSSSASVELARRRIADSIEVKTEPRGRGHGAMRPGS